MVSDRSIHVVERDWDAPIARASRYCSSARSEDDFRAKLNLARRADDAGNSSGVARADGRVRQIELRRVEDIEAFGAKLEPRALLDAELLEKREVEVHAPRPVQDIPARIAIGECRRRRKR